MKIPRTVLSIEARREYCAKERFHSEEIRFEPDFCEDPILALENFKASSYDLIRLDIKMPEMDQETLAINKESQTPILECNSTSAWTLTYSKLSLSKLISLNIIGKTCQKIPLQR